MAPKSPPSAQSPKKTLSAKEQREALRVEKVAELRRKQEKEKRNRLIGILSASIAGVLVLAVIVTFVVLNGNKDDQADDPIEGLQTFTGLPANHIEGLTDEYPDGTVDYEAEYGNTPPVGGNHSGVWLNCGIYSEPVPNENAVHSLEHGSVWVTYDPALSDGDVQALREQLPTTKAILSPYEGLPSSVVISAWGAQVELDGVDDPRINQFITQYWNSPSAPEPNAPCDGGTDAPGRVA